MVSTHRKIFVKLKFTSPNFRVENSQNLSNHHLLVQTIQRSLKLPTPNTAFQSGNPWNLYHICLLLLWSNSPQNGSHLMTNVPSPIPVAGLGCFFTISPPRCYFHRTRVVRPRPGPSPNVVVLRHQPCCKPKAMCAFFFGWVETHALINAVLGKSVGFFWGKSCLLL